MAAIEFRHVDKVFPDGTRTISDLTFAVGDGEFLVIVGPSGCGKSTVLRMLAGLESVTGGEIVIDGRIVNDWPPQRRNMAMVFQDYALYPHMSVRQNLEFPLRLQRLGKDEVRRRVADTAQLLDLSAVLERKPRQLSGGQRQRVAMGRAVVRRPGVFLMDEPLSNVDAKLRVQIRTEIAALQGRLQTTTIYVTHDQVEAMTLGHRVVLLRGGVVQQIAPPQELYDRPANIFVAAFLGNPGMNIVPVALKPAGDGHLVIELFDQGPVRLRCPAAAERDRAATGWIGVRPEALCVADDRAETMKDTMTLTVEVTSVEALGHESLVYARLRHRQDAPSGGTSEQPAAELGAAPGTLVARLPAARAPATHAPGPHALGAERTLRLAVNPEDIHIFGPDGRALAHSAATSTSRDSTGTHAHPAAGGPAATPQPAGRRWAPSR